MDIAGIKNILFLTHPESDYGGAFLYNGLCQYYGADAVFDFPIKRSHHGECHNYTLPGRDQGVTGPLPWMSPYVSPWGEYNDAPTRFGIFTEGLDEVVCAKLRDGFFQLIVLESLRDMAMQAYKIVAPFIGNTPLVVHDGEDYAGIHPNTPRAKLILKREVLKNKRTDYAPNVIPFPFSFPTNKMDEIMRHESGVPYSYDVTFMAGRTCDTRQEVADCIRESDLNHHVVLSPDSPRNGVVCRDTGLMPWGQYLDLMASSRAAVSVRGFGWDTCRAWEIPACTMMIRDTLGIEIPDDFQHMQNALIANNHHEFVQFARWAKENEKDAEGLAVNGHAHLMARHTNLQRVSYLLERLSGV